MMLRRGKRVALFVDGPNMIRKEFSLDLLDLRKTAGKYGRVVSGKVFLNQHASSKLIEAISNQGFESRIVIAGEKADVDVSIAVEIVKTVYENSADIIALVSRDADFLPALQLAKKKGKAVLVIGADSCFSKALQNVADYTEMIGNKQL
jgi:uncharacterized protein (TIGR00288 family)